MQPESADGAQALLLIGDKVITAAPDDFEFQIDLGAAWKEWTSLPFVFAVWTGRAGAVDPRLGPVLSAARDRGVADAAQIAHEQGPARGWPGEMAEAYLTKHMKYVLTDRMREGMGAVFARGGGGGASAGEPGGDAMTAASRVAAGPATTSRLSDDEALSLFHEASLHELGRRAFEFSMRLHPEPERTYVVDRNINYANWCTAKCIFCNFKADPPGVNSSRPELPGGYALSFDEIGRKIDELVAIGGTQILMQGGLCRARSSGSTGTSNCCDRSGRSIRRFTCTRSARRRSLRFIRSSA